MKRCVEVEKVFYEYYCDIDYCCEEWESNFRLLEVVFEGRNSSSVVVVMYLFFIIFIIILVLEIFLFFIVFLDLFL